RFLVLGVAPSSFLIRPSLSLPWHLTPQPALARHVALALSVILASDGLLQVTFSLLFRDRYQSRYQALADYFRRQGPLEITGAGLLAGGEELFFRGVLLDGL